MAKVVFTVGIDYEVIEQAGEYFWQGLGEYEQAKARSRKGLATEGLAIADAESSLRCLEELKESEQKSQSVV